MKQKQENIGKSQAIILVQIKNTIYGINKCHINVI